MARFDLANPDPRVRLSAVTEILRSPDEQTTALLRERFDQEYAYDVKREMATGLAMADLDGGDKATRLAAIAVVAGRLTPEVLNRLKAIVEKTPDGGFVEPDEEIRTAATKAIDRIEQARSIYAGAETLFFGLGLGAVLVLVAIGLAITFGVMGVINMAHGELMMLGAYTTYVVQTLMPNYIGWSIAVAIPAAFLVSGLTGILIERSIIRFLYGRPLETLLATFGVSLVLQQAVRSIFTALNRSVATPSWMSGTLVLNDALSLTYNRLYIILFTMVVFGVLLAVLKRYAPRPRDPRRVAEPRDGPGDGHPHGARRRPDLRARLRHRRHRRRRAEPAHQRRPQPRAGLHHRFVHGRGVRRRRQPVGHAHRRHVDGRGQQAPRAVRRAPCWPRSSCSIALILFIQRRPRGLFPQTGRAAEQG